MNKAKHTPGPWKATEKTVTAPETEDRLGLDVRIYGGNGKDNRANARLIAAAPDLLEALQAFVKYADDVSDDSPELDRARAAITKATRGDT